VKIPYVNEKQEMLNVGENGKASMTLDALEVAPDRLKPLRELTAELQGRRK